MTSIHSNFSPEELREHKELFDTFDTDGSGELDAEELQQLCATLGNKMTIAEAKEMIDDIDIDGNADPVGQKHQWCHQCHGHPKERNQRHPGRLYISGNLLHPPGQSAAMSHGMARILLGRLGRVLVTFWAAAGVTI